MSLFLSLTSTLASYVASTIGDALSEPQPAFVTHGHDPFPPIEVSPIPKECSVRPIQDGTGRRSLVRCLWACM